jgi:phytoene dehydrogenase-like protein
MSREHMDRPRVVIVGAGLAGLACGVELTAAGVTCEVLEASGDVGGRVRTDEVEGFLLDRGFQVLLTAYPEARRLLDYEALDLRRFFPGAVIRSGGRFRRLADPWRRPLAGVGGVLSGAVSPADALRIARLRARVRRGTLEELRSHPERSTLERLRLEGFSQAIVHRFFRPFFGGVFLDPGLDTTDRQLEFVFRMFAAGDIAVPSAGMGEIPRQLASRLPAGSVRLGVRVESVDGSSVRLTGGGSVEAAAVVVAADATDVRALIDLPDTVRWRGVTCLYFAADRPPIAGPVLVLDGDGGGPVNNLCVMSEVSPGYSPAGRSLVSVTCLGPEAGGDEALERAVRTQLRSWFGPSVGGWRHLRTYRIERALPDQRPPTPGPGAIPVRLRERLYVCGDYRADGSINGAMASGRAAAEAVLSDLGPGSR